jgi:two-component system nitrogen regulation sensor histidine kinase NtrY
VSPIRAGTLPFRQRILLVLIALGAIPTAIAIFGWALTIRTNNPATAARAAVEGIGASGRVMVETIDTNRLRGPERRALAAHAEALNRAMVRTQAAEAYGQYYYAGLAAMLLALGALYVYAAVRLGGHLSRQMSRPIDELIGWTGHIARHEAIPEEEALRGAPEFESLRTALRAMAGELEEGRARELETERIRAFGEVARRVAHEMKNPLTPIGFAVKSLAATARPEQLEAIEVLAAESERLQRLAKEFAELGRLPEGPAAEVDLAELLEELRRTAIPPEVESTLQVHPRTPLVMGHYDALRRAFSNLIRNGIEAMDGTGRLDLRVAPGGGGVIVAIADHGPGVPEELRSQVFEPYWTTKDEGTGLGLALVRQTAVAHGGSVDVRETAGGGATFVVMLSGRSPSPEAGAGDRG